MRAIWLEGYPYEDFHRDVRLPLEPVRARSVGHFACTENCPVFQVGRCNTFSLQHY